MTTPPRPSTGTVFGDRPADARPLASGSLRGSLGLVGLFVAVLVALAAPLLVAGALGVIGLGALGSHALRSRAERRQTAHRQAYTAIE